MKNKLTLLVFTICFAFSCCKVTHAPVSSITKGTLDKAIEGWCSNLCDYPKSLDEFVSYAEEHDSWKKRTIKDSLQTTLSFLKEEEEHIVWQFNHPTVTTMSLPYYIMTIPFSGKLTNYPSRVLMFHYTPTIGITLNTRTLSRN